MFELSDHLQPRFSLAACLRKLYRTASRELHVDSPHYPNFCCDSYCSTKTITIDVTDFRPLLKMTTSTYSKGHTTSEMSPQLSELWLEDWLHLMLASILDWENSKANVLLKTKIQPWRPRPRPLVRRMFLSKLLSPFIFFVQNAVSLAPKDSVLKTLMKSESYSSCEPITDVQFLDSIQFAHIPSV